MPQYFSGDNDYFKIFNLFIKVIAEQCGRLSQFFFILRNFTGCFLVKNFYSKLAALAFLQISFWKKTFFVPFLIYYIVSACVYLLLNRRFIYLERYLFIFSYFGGVVAYFASMRGDPGLNPGGVGIFSLCTLYVVVHSKRRENDFCSVCGMIIDQWRH